MRVLVTAASRHGSTLELATEIGARLRESLPAPATIVDVRDIDDVDSVAGYQAVVVGSAVYLGQWLDAAKRFAATYGPALRDIPVWLFSSGPVGDPLVPEPGSAVDVGSVVDLLGPVEHRVFAGAIDRSALRFAERTVVRALHVPEGDFRDWAAVREWAVHIAEALAARNAALTGT